MIINLHFEILELAAAHLQVSEPILISPAQSQSCLLCS